MDNQEERFTIWHGLLLTEGPAIVIALLMPITPSKTGSEGSIADWFFPDPSYLQEVIVSFLFVNLLLLILGVIFMVWLKVKE